MDWLRARPWVAWYGLSVVALVVGLVLVPWYAGAPLWSFMATLGGTLCLLIAFGDQVTTYAFGMLRDGQNGYSLSRLQMVAWTWLILSALIAVSAARLWHGAAGEAVNIYIPTEPVHCDGYRVLHRCRLSRIAVFEDPVLVHAATAPDRSPAHG